MQTPIERLREVLRRLDNRLVLPLAINKTYSTGEHNFASDLRSLVASRSLKDAPRDGMPFVVRTTHTFRWEPYKDEVRGRKNHHSQVIDGMLGRWQYLDDHGRWINTPEPKGEWIP